MSYVTNKFLLASSSAQSKQLVFVHHQGQKSEQKHKTKNFVEFRNHSPLLTIVLISLDFDDFCFSVVVLVKKDVANTSVSSAMQMSRIL